MNMNAGVIKKFGVTRECVYVDKQNGKDFDRPAWSNLMARLAKSDTLVVSRPSRQELRRDDHATEHHHSREGSPIAVIDLPLLDIRNKYGNDLTAKLISNLVIQVFSYVAETERTMKPSA